MSTEYLEKVYSEAVAKCEAGIVPFEVALVMLKEGRKVARKGWNGKGMFIFLCHPLQIEYRGAEVCEVIEFAEEMPDAIAMMTADSKIQVGWLASQADLLATDWEIVG